MTPPTSAIPVVVAPQTAHRFVMLIDRQVFRAIAMLRDLRSPPDERMNPKDRVFYHHLGPLLLQAACDNRYVCLMWVEEQDSGDEARIITKMVRSAAALAAFEDEAMAEVWFELNRHQGELRVTMMLQPDDETHFRQLVEGSPVAAELEVVRDPSTITLLTGRSMQDLVDVMIDRHCRALEITPDDCLLSTPRVVKLVDGSLLITIIIDRSRELATPIPAGMWFEQHPDSAA